MYNSKKEWIVKTKSKEVLGPFTQTELLKQLESHVFTLNDEICCTLGHWISAHTLQARDSDEITRTSSRINTTTTGISVSDLTPTSTQTDKFFTPSPPIPNPLKTNPLNRSLPSEKPLDYVPKVPLKMGSSKSEKQTSLKSNTTKRYPLLTALTLTGICVLFFYRPANTKRETTEVASSLQILEKPKTTDTEIVRKSKLLIQTGKNKQALKLLANYHEGHSGTDSSYLSLYAGLLITEGESTLRAKKILDQTLLSKGSPQLKAEAHLWLGYLLISEDDEGDMGESHFLEALQLDPKDPTARFNLGRAYLKQKKYQQALDYLQLAELELPNFWLIQVHKGWAKLALGLTADASQSFKAAVDDSRDRWVSYIYQSIFYLKNKEPEAAKDSVLKMLSRDPDFEKLSPIPLGFFQSKTNYDEYLVAYSQVMEKASDEDKLIGRIYITYLANPLSRAEDWRKMDALANRSGNILPRILSLKMLLPHAIDAGYLKNIISRLPPNLDYFGPYPYVLRAQAREKLNQISEAQTDYQKALAIDPQSAVALWYQYELFKKLHRGSEAIETLKKLLYTHPNYIPALEHSKDF
ncbi:MAG: tetratricopeptide repeat protein [Bdellovibrionales bacterium]|nr:tetratricopeptide repeat protein [Bdellovibrionales bacterium]